jgi:hypothetical protein
MDEPDWMTVLRIFWEENLNFEYTGNPENMDNFIPDHPDLEGINTISHAKDLLKSGHLEVEDVDLSHNPSAPIDNLTVIRISEKGIKAIREWETAKAQAQWERRLLETQEEYEEDRLERQQKFEKEQVTRANEVNAAIGFLTIGLLIVTLSDVLLSVRQNILPPSIILVSTVLIVIGLIYKIGKSGLLSPE